MHSDAYPQILTLIHTKELCLTHQNPLFTVMLVLPTVGPVPGWEGYHLKDSQWAGRNMGWLRGPDWSEHKGPGPVLKGKPG